MNTHDNDMDQLFRQKLDDFEVEPSANVWAGISAELGNAPKRRSIVPMLRIAAGVAVIISAGLFFLPKKQVGVQPINGHKLAVKPIVKPASVQPAPSQAPTQIPSVNMAVAVQHVAITRPHHSLGTVNRAIAQVPVAGNVPLQPVVAPVQVDPVVNTQAAMIAATTSTNTSTVNNPTMPVASTQIIEKTKDLAPILSTQPANTAVMASVGQVDSDSKPAKKRKFSLGKVLNAAVGLVDKRQDKLIEFSDTDEGEAITGINIGILKVKKVE